MRPHRIILATLLAVLVPVLVAPAAEAAPPNNDLPSGARPITLGDRVVEDTSQATTGNQDAALNQNCGAPETKASVWFTYRARTDGSFLLDMRGSDYTGGLLVFAGTPTPGSLVTCGPDMVGVRGRAHTTYTIMAVSDSAVNGGRLVLSLRKAPPPPKVHVTIAKRGLAYKGGAARVRGHYRCAHGQGLAFVDGKVNQRAGRLKIPSSFSKVLRCNGKRHAWSARVVSRTGIYDRGPARVKVTIVACGMFRCKQDRAERRVHLVRAWGDHQRRPSRSQRMQTSTKARTAEPTPLAARGRHWQPR